MIFDITIKDTDVLESEDEDEETEGNTPTKDQANQQSTSDEDSRDEITPMNTPQSRPTQPEKMTPMAKGGQVVLVYFSLKDLDIFKAPLFEDNGGSFIGSHRRDNPEFNSAWERMEARKRETNGEEKWDKLPEGKKHN